MKSYDVIIVGAGAAGLMCAAIAGQRGRSVLLLDHANKPGKKILISGGGKCNFTNYHIEPGNYLCQNPHFAKSALSRYTQWDFIALLEKYQIPFHERDHGQLFCDHKAKDIVELLLNECRNAQVAIQCNTAIEQIRASRPGFILQTDSQQLRCDSLVIASGGLSIPKMGATAFGLKIAEQFNLAVVAPRAGLVPFTLHDQDKAFYQALSGISVDAEICANNGQCFREALLFTHRGLSGPAALQLSSYWNSGEFIAIDLLPDENLQTLLELAKQQGSQQLSSNFLSQYLPKRLVQARLDQVQWQDKPLQQLSKQDLLTLHELFKQWQLKPNGTEGYRTAEVTVGGVDTNELSSKTMESKKVPGLYFIGEVMDVTGHLGGYNFQWAWSSGYVAGQYV